MRRVTFFLVMSLSLIIVASSILSCIANNMEAEEKRRNAQNFKSQGLGVEAGK